MDFNYALIAVGAESVTLPPDLAVMPVCVIRLVEKCDNIRTPSERLFGFPVARCPLLSVSVAVSVSASISYEHQVTTDSNSSVTVSRSRSSLVVPFPSVCLSFVRSVVLSFCRSVVRPVCRSSLSRSRSL